VPTPEERRADINRFVDDAAEGVALHFASEVPADEKIAAMVAVYRDGTLSESQIQNLAQKMHLTPDEFVVSWNAMANNLQHQLTAMANAHGVTSRNSQRGCVRAEVAKHKPLCDSMPFRGTLKVPMRTTCGTSLLVEISGNHGPIREHGSRPPLDR
jgi:hypothetical protein